MAVPRDPDFWKRFSYAVHQDEEAQVNEKYVSPSPSPCYLIFLFPFASPPSLPPPSTAQTNTLPSQIKIHLAAHDPPQKTPLLHPHMPNLLDPAPRHNNNLRRRNSDIGENRRAEENTHWWGGGRTGGES
ncbi:hypothetical protein D6D06_06365 [Aureobasidium pullulans]|nr:hypothetical protein D6D06_06365 [Aureobasidium pullulans]